jgi:hypothetical protein
MSDIDFDAALAPLEPKNTARMPLRGVKVNSPADVILIGVHAGENNKKLQSLSDKLAAKHAAELAGGDPAAQRALVNAMFAELYSKTVITGWENVCEPGGKPAPFTVDTCCAFLLALGKKRPDIAAAGRAIENYFSRAPNFADGYVDTEALGEG